MYVAFSCLAGSVYLIQDLFRAFPARLQVLYHWLRVETDAPNVWLVTCKYYILGVPSSFSLSTPSLALKWLPLDLIVLVTYSKPKKDAVLARNANFPMIFLQHLEREPGHSHINRTHHHHQLLARLERETGHSCLNRIHHLHPLLLYLELGREEPVRHQEMSATFIGIQVNATEDSIVHSDTKRTLDHSLETLILLVK